MYTNKGLTLLDFLCGLVVLFVSILEAHSLLQNALRNYQCRTTISYIHSQLTIARHWAISHKARVYMCPSANGSSCNLSTNWNSGQLIYSTTTDGPYTNTTSLQTIHFASATPKNIHVYTTNGRQSVRFLPDGRSAGSNVCFRVYLEDQLMGLIFVNNLGRIRSVYL